MRDRRHIRVVAIVSICCRFVCVACVDLPESTLSGLDGSVPALNPGPGSNDAGGGAIGARDAEAPIDVGPISADVMREFLEQVAPILGGMDGRSGSCGPWHAIPGGIGPASLAPN